MQTRTFAHSTTFMPWCACGLWKDSLYASALSFYHVRAGDWTQVLRFGSKSHYPRSHLASSAKWTLRVYFPNPISAWLVEIGRSYFRCSFVFYFLLTEMKIHFCVVSSLFPLPKQWIYNGLHKDMQPYACLSDRRYTRIFMFIDESKQCKDLIR